MSPSVPYRYINKLCLIPFSGVKFVHKAYIEAKMGIYLMEKD